MFFHFQVLLQSIIFFFVLELFASDWVSSFLSSISNFGQLLLALLGFAVVLGYFYQATRKIAREFSMTSVPVIFVLCSIGMLYFVQSLKQQFLLIALSSIAFYFMQLALYRIRIYRKDQTALGIIAAASVATLFLFYAVSYGVYLNFAISLGILMAVMLIGTTLISFQYLFLIAEDNKKAFKYALFLGLVMGEIVWILNFWPFGYLTTGVITLIFYYVFWDLVHSHFASGLSKKRVVTNMIFFGILVAIVLTSTRWLPIV